MYDNQQRTRPYASPQTGRVFLHQFKHGSPGRGLLVSALITSLLALAIGAASLTLFLSSRGTAAAQATQVSQLRAEVASQASALSAARSAGAASFASVNGKIASIGSLLGTYGMVCSTDLTGPDGPAQFWFACTDQKP